MDFFDLAKEYGVIVAIAIFLHIPPYMYLWKNRKMIDSIPEINEKLSNIHLQCHIPRGVLETVKSEIAELKEKDVEIDGDIRKVLEHLKGNDKAFDKLDAKVDRVLDILIKKAIQQ